MGRFIAISGAYGAGKSTALAAIAPILGAHVITLPSPRVVPGLPPDAPARVCRDAALGLGLERGRLALLADCLAAVEDARGREGLTLASCCALDTAAHQGEPEAVLRLCGAVRPDLVVWLDVSPDVAARRMLTRGDVPVTAAGMAQIGWRYADAVTDARVVGWAVRHVDADRPIAEVVAEVLGLVRRAL